MKFYIKILSSFFLLIFLCSCGDIQKSVEDKAKNLQKEVEKRIDDHMETVDSSFHHLDTTIQNNIEQHLQKADSLLQQVK